jgi:hypothetical protein
MPRVGRQLWRHGGWPRSGAAPQQRRGSRSPSSDSSPRQTGRPLVITRKGGKVVTIPLAPHTARAIDLAIGERTEGSLFTTADGSAWTGTALPGSSGG